MHACMCKFHYFTLHLILGKHLYNLTFRSAISVYFVATCFRSNLAGHFACHCNHSSVMVHDVHQAMILKDPFQLAYVQLALILEVKDHNVQHLTVPVIL